MSRGIIFATVFAVAVPVAAFAQSGPFPDWPEPARSAAKAAPVKKPASKPAPVRAEPAKAGPQKSAPEAKPKLEPVMKAMLVRGSRPECEPNCPEWISLEGRIVGSSSRELKKVLSQIGTRKPPVILSSLGGDVDQAYAMARMIRAKGLDVAVGKTELRVCEPADKACRQRQSQGAAQGAPSNQRAICASACPIVLAGGVRRFVGPNAFLGVHEILTIQTPIRITRMYRVETRTNWGVPVSQRKILVSERREALKPRTKSTPGDSYVKLGEFFLEHGVQGMVLLYMSASHDSIHWVTRAEQLSTRIATHFVSPANMLAGELTLPVPPARVPDTGEAGASAAAR